ncbi:hypothetical protein HNR23_005000 [Nocardiopsis mwathae]|uniref:Uncharacterized protein n=1 Tax=Nocardiopsis mwathae TaxID=1472723 RepID=A0A7W9YMK3_9ACTN|nr:hypothetical protein [Nocardiopsis mwathae]MBB6174940.1 hypothetical protein [Nocardiopsis mwathae]
MTCVDGPQCLCYPSRESWPYCALAFLTVSTFATIGLGYDLATVLVIVLVVLTIGPRAISRLHRR